MTDAQQLLQAYVSAPEKEMIKYWEALSEKVRELIHKAAYKRDVNDLEDFEEECVVAIWAKIVALRAEDSSSGIDNLEAFVRQAVHNRYCDAIRRKRPKWYNLKLELMEIFTGKTNIEGFAFWLSPNTGAKLCGFSGWEGASKSGSAKCREITNNTSNFRGKHLQNRDPKELPIYELAAAVLDFCNAPIEIDVLTSCIADLVRARNEEPLSLDALPSDDDSAAPVDWLISPDTDVEKQVVDSEWFSHVIDWFWKEFLQLSLKQKKALLYGMSVEQVMALASAVGLKEIAKSLEMSADKLAPLIHGLPVTDSEIARELGVLTKAVPSVRFKAWGRIRRRTRKSSLSLDE